MSSLPWGPVALLPDPGVGVLAGDAVATDVDEPVALGEVVLESLLVFIAGQRVPGDQGRPGGDSGICSSADANVAEGRPISRSLDAAHRAEVRSRRQRTAAASGVIRRRHRSRFQPGRRGELGPSRLRSGVANEAQTTSEAHRPLNQGGNRLHVPGVVW